jgi:hypothetical protein
VESHAAQQSTLTQYLGSLRLTPRAGLTCRAFKAAPLWHSTLTTPELGPYIELSDRVFVGRETGVPMKKYKPLKADKR